MSALKLLVSTAAVLMPTVVTADDGARIGIRATVPTICRVDTAQSVLLQGGDEYDLGQVSELCNNVGGYRIVLSHPEGLSNAEAIIDGVSVPLSASGRTVLVDSSVPAARSRQVRLKLGAGSSGVAHIGLQAVPKGFVY